MPEVRLIDANALEKYMTDIMPENTFSAYGKGVHDILTHLINFIRKEMPTFRQKIVTNADKIRAMSDEELQHLLDTATDSCHYRYCDECPLKYSDEVPRCNISEWLKQEVQEDGKN